MLRKGCLTENFIHEAAVLLCKDLTAQTRRKHHYPKRDCRTEASSIMRGPFFFNV